MEKRDEINMLAMHCKEDIGMLLHILEDYVRLRDYEYEGRIGAALEECRRLIRALREKEERALLASEESKK